MLREPSKFLATIQIGITLAGFLSSAFAADAFADDLAPVLQNLFPLGLAIWRNISIVLITIILSYFSLVFGELVPTGVKHVDEMIKELVGRFPYDPKMFEMFIGQPN